MDKYIGQMIDNRYEMLEVIGIGGMAIVYKAKCHRLNRYVAIKILKDEYAADEELRKGFHDEAHAVAMLSHPNIVSVYDVSRESLEYIVMELIDGITLKEYLGRRGKLSYEEITFFAIQIAKALEHAHSREIIHRDIKPHNIMILRDGTVKVADFGIAYLMSNQKTYSNGEAIGSVHYVSPEQAKGGRIDMRADLYSFGVVLYEMLTGRLPFEGATPISIALQHINSTPLPPSDFVEGIPQALENITMKAMEPTLSKRYTSATEMLKDLEGFKADPSFVVEQKPVVVPPDAGSEHDTIKIPPVKPDKGAENPEKNGQGSRVIQKEKGGSDMAKGEKPKRERTESALPTSLLFSIFAVALFFIGAAYFVLEIVNPFGDPVSNKVEAPTLVGQYYADVEQNATSLYSDFVIVLDEQVYHDTVPAGQIIEQNPYGGRSVDIGTEISVVVSRGPRKITLDNYVGVDIRQVEVDLNRLGLIPIIQEEHDEDVGESLVISTTPAANAELSAGDTVTLLVSLGRELEIVEVPNLVGKTEADAIEALNSAGLEAGEISYVESELEPGTVIFQVIPADSEVEEETTVDFHVSKLSDQPINPDDPTVPGEPINPGDGTGGTDVPQGTGTSYDPYPDAENKRWVKFLITLADSEAAISVTVHVNGNLQYQGTHYTAEGQTSVTLTGYTGYNTIIVRQDGVETFHESLNFE